MAVPEALAIGLLVAALAGGALGAALGGLQAFALAGFVVVVGEATAILARAAEIALPVDLTATVGFGVVLGPHVAFAGGAAAVAYAAKRGYVEQADGAYHPAKAIDRGLAGRPDVLAVGAIFGLVGYATGVGSRAIGLPVDPIALGVVVSAVAHRLALGYDLVGTATNGDWLDMSPFDRFVDGDDPAVLSDGGGEESAAPSATADREDDTAARRPPVEPWLPHMSRWPTVAGVGLAFGVLGAYLAHVTGSAFLAFGLSAFSLALLAAGVAEIPVTHHVTLPASTVVLAMAGAEGGRMGPAAVQGSVGLGSALLAGAAIGLLGALCGEVIQRRVYAHAETHLDPPAVAIVLTTLVVGVLAIAGVLPSSAWIPTP